MAGPGGATLDAAFGVDTVMPLVTTFADETRDGFFSDLFRSGILPLDAVLINVTPPDEHGYCSLGVSVEGMLAAIPAATTVIAHGEDVAMNVTGCDGMGTGGCGDVLTGTIAALLAQGMSVWDAARAGAYYHGRAGEAAQARLGARGVTAWDACEALRIE